MRAASKSDRPHYCSNLCCYIGSSPSFQLNPCAVLSHCWLPLVCQQRRRCYRRTDSAGSQNGFNSLGRHSKRALVAIPLKMNVFSNNASKRRLRSKNVGYGLQCKTRPRLACIDHERHTYGLILLPHRPEFFGHLICSTSRICGPSNHPLAPIQAVSGLSLMCLDQSSRTRCVSAQPPSWQRPSIMQAMASA